MIFQAIPYSIRRSLRRKSMNVYRLTKRGSKDREIMRIEDEEVRSVAMLNMSTISCCFYFSVNLISYLMSALSLSLHRTSLSMPVAPPLPPPPPAR
jgi:hypothetical protein